MPLKQVEAVSVDDLWQQYRRLLEHATADIYVCGRYAITGWWMPLAEGFSGRAAGEADLQRCVPWKSGNTRWFRKGWTSIKAKLVAWPLSGDITQRSKLYPPP